MVPVGVMVLSEGRDDERRGGWNRGTMTDADDAVTNRRRVDYNVIVLF
jgi:hypothetical protein